MTRGGNTETKSGRRYIQQAILRTAWVHNVQLKAVESVRKEAALFWFGGLDALDPWKPERPCNGEIGSGILDGQRTERRSVSEKKNAQKIPRRPHRSIT